MPVARRRKQSRSRSTKRVRRKTSRSRQSRRSRSRRQAIPPVPALPAIPAPTAPAALSSRVALAGGPAAFPPNRVYLNKPNVRLEFRCNSRTCKGAMYTRPFQCVTSTLPHAQGVPIAIAECPRCHGTMEYNLSVRQFMHFINLNKESRCSFDYHME